MRERQREESEKDRKNRENQRVKLALPLFRAAHVGVALARVYT